MRRLCYLGVIGCLIIVIDAAGTGTSFLKTLSVALMAAGAAMLVGGLLGFLFGVPHTREGEQVPTPTKSPEDQGRQSESVVDSALMSYRPNTSLEQISDWLTKILVGVGLVQIKSIPGKLKDLAAYIGQDLDGTTRTNAFVLTILIYFSLTGFIFGFLWARIYLPSWFKETDQGDIKRLDKKVNELGREFADAMALVLIHQQLNRSADDEVASDEDIADAIRVASTPIKAQIFELAQSASEDTNAYDYDLKNQSVIAIFKALIASDPNGRFHRNYSELSYAYSRRRPADLDKAEKSVSTAIELRDRLRAGGWKYYELRRARYRIQRDPDFKNGKPSVQDSTSQIMADLRVAFDEPDKWPRWLRENPDVRKWLALNDVTEEQLRSS
jgi:hypothetical protein